MHLKCTIVKKLTRRNYCYMNTPSLQYLMLLTSGVFEVFLMITNQIITISMHLKCTIVKKLTRRKYCYMNTPSLRYFMLLTSGG